MLFARLNGVAGQAVDRVNGEPVRITPRTAAMPKRPLSGDPSREQILLTARFTLEPREADLEGQRRGTDLGGFTTLQGADAMLVISSSEAAKLPYRLQDGDLIELLSPLRAETPRWRALRQLPGNGTLVVIPLNRDLT